jgi:kinesin family protein 5
MVDLAGSEKISKTAAQGKTLEEAKKINLSLSALGNVINSLTDGHSKHIPYRSSTLTRILQDSLGGNSKTSLIVTCSPSYYNLLETVGTLRFGQRAKCIKNSPKVNKEHTVEELIKLLEEQETQNAKLKGRVQYLESKLSEHGIAFELDHGTHLEDTIVIDAPSSRRDTNLAFIMDRESREVQTDEDPLIKINFELEDKCSELIHNYKILKAEHTHLKEEFSENESELHILRENLEMVVIEQLNDKENYSHKVLFGLSEVGDLAAQIREANLHASLLEKRWELK